MAEARHKSGRKADRPLQPVSTDFPDRLYYRIGEVARICGVAPSVLRFWETQFPQFKPNKGGSGQRLYRRKDLELALRIRQLLYSEGYTLHGARHALANPPGKSEPTPQSRPQPLSASLSAIRTGLLEIVRLLSQGNIPQSRLKVRTADRKLDMTSLFPDTIDQSFPEKGAQEHPRIPGL